MNRKEITPSRNGVLLLPVHFFLL